MTFSFHLVAQRAQVGDPNDLVDVALVAGACAGLLPAKVAFVKPRRWKGTAPKRVTNRRTREVLTSEEVHVYTVAMTAVPAGLRHNVLDAIGIGLWALGRKRRTR